MIAFSAAAETIIRLVHLATAYAGGYCLGLILARLKLFE